MAGRDGVASFEASHPSNRQNPSPAQPTAFPIHVELIGCDTARAVGIVAEGGSPVLKLCRKLIAAGFDPDHPLEAWRGSTLALTVHCIGEAAELKVNPKGTSFIKAACAGPTAPLARPPSKNDPKAIDSGSPC